MTGCRHAGPFGVALMLLSAIPCAPRFAAAAPPAADDTAALARGNSEFAFTLFQTICRDSGTDNVFISPYSISAALAMTAAGAAGQTEAQMLTTLGLKAVADPHAAFAALDALLRAPAIVRPDETGSPPTLRIANRLWPRDGEKLLSAYLERVRKHYAAEPEVLNFGDAAAAAARINAWVAEQTQDRITDLLTADHVRFAALVLTNAVYFKGSWLRPFEPGATAPAPFTRLDGKAVDVPTMNATLNLRHATGDGLQAVELPYVGQQWSMIVLVPESERFAAVAAALDAAAFARTVAELKPAQVRLALPKWTFRSRFRLPPMLKSLGMTDAFHAGAADFSRMDGTRELFISEVIHEAFVAVDETGTEAAAATAVVMTRSSAVPRETIELRVDRPFLFAIYDRATATILFLGRVTDPAAK